MPVAAPAAPVARPVGPRSLDRARYRVLERRDVRTAVEFELAFVPPFIVVELILLAQASAEFAVAAFAALVALGLLVLGWRRGMRRRPHPTAFLIGVIVFGMGIVAASTTQVIAMLMNGMFAVVVIGCAVWMPWSPRWHVAFLALSVLSLAVGLAIAPLAWLEISAGVIVGICAVLTSALGMWLVRRRHLRMWGQTIELRRQKSALARTVRELTEAEHRVRRLEGILPICASCKRIRDGAAWLPVEGYVSAHSDAQFSHGICPDCAARLYPDDIPVTAGV